MRVIKRNDYSEMLLVDNGVCRCTVVIGDDANEKVQEAAADFCRLLQAMTGATCPVIKESEVNTEENLVLIGPSEFTARVGVQTPTGYPGNERVIVRREADRLILLGNDDGAYTGTQFAVTAFFEKMGCGWYAPDPLWHVIPKRETLSVGYLNIDHKPTFISRRNNVLRQCPELGRRWYLGGEKRVIGHALTFMVPREEMFPIHPEWFCMLEGQRNPYVEWWQYCYTNEELMQTFADKICEKFDADPEMTQYSVAVNDGWQHGWCQCEKCRELGTPSEIVIHVANDLARRVGKRYPNHKLTFLSYFPTYFPPRKPMNVEPNVEIMFCKETDMFRAVDKGPDNGYHQRYYHKHSKNSYPAPWRENFEQWLERVPTKNRAIWDWYCIAAAYPAWKDIPWVQGDVATRNNRYWYDHGVQYVYNDQGPLPAFYEDAESFPLRFPLWFVAAKSWWDTDLTGSDILMDACRKLYGDAKDLMFAYYAALADIAANNTAYTIAWHPPKPCQLYTPEAIARIDRILDAVRSLIPGQNETVARRIQIQLDLWQKAKDAIEEDAPKPDEISNDEMRG